MAAPDADAGLAARITLLTDFGTADGYVAAMRGVIAGRAPSCFVDDTSHFVPPGDVRAAAFVLSSYWRLYPPGTVHVVVVDPGVGTVRRPLVITADDRIGVGPDNGVLTPMLAQATAVHEILDPGLIRQPASMTFHGRDIFAPAAAYMAGGGLITNVGPAVSHPVVLEMPAARRKSGGVHGCVIHVDRFGTLVTNIPADMIADGAHVHVRGADAGLLRRTFGDVAPGEPVAIIGSGGHLEIAVRDGSAALRFGAGRDDEVSVLPAP